MTLENLMPIIDAHQPELATFLGIFLLFIWIMVVE